MVDAGHGGESKNNKKCNNANFASFPTYIDLMLV